MAALVCDVCGGKLSMGSGGIAVCESCGMEHTKDRMQEKIQEIKGTVRIDNSHMVENYLNIARTAYDASNLTEAETYCNKIIEISPSNAEAWLIKGKAAGWQSTLANLRFSESIAAFSKAISNTPENERELFELDTIDEIAKLSRAIVNLRGEHFEKYPDKDVASGLLNDLRTILITLEQYYNQVSKTIHRSQIMGPIASQIDDIVNNAWEYKIHPEYVGDENKPDKYDFEKYLDRIGCCIDLLKIAIQLSSDDDEDDIHRYEMMIKLEQAAIESCSWDYEFTEYGKRWSKEYTLTDNAITIRREEINKSKNKIAEIKAFCEAEKTRKRIEKEQKEQEEAEQRYRQYWEEHIEEKKALEEKIQNLSEQLKIGRDEIKRLESDEEQKNLKNRIKQLEQERASLGVFKRQEKKSVQEKIDFSTSQLSSLIEKQNAAIEIVKNKLKPIESELNEYQAELMKAR